MNSHDVHKPTETYLQLGFIYYSMTRRDDADDDYDDPAGCRLSMMGESVEISFIMAFLLIATIEYVGMATGNAAGRPDGASWT